MKILILQEAGRHEGNKNFRESLCLKRGFERLNCNVEVWGLNYNNSKSFEELEQWTDIIIVIENYNFNWIPIEKIANSKKLKLYWSIDSHCNINPQISINNALNVDIHLNSSAQYCDRFNAKKHLWFPNAYDDSLITPLDVEKKYNIGFCGNILNRQGFIDTLSQFNIKVDIMVIGNEMVKAINSYKIHFNHNIIDDINYRTFETLGCKTLLMTNKTPNVEKLFDLQKHLVIYNDLSDLVQKVKYYISNESEINVIAESGYNHVKKYHTYFNRCELILKNI